MLDERFHMRFMTSIPSIRTPESDRVVNPPSNKSERDEFEPGRDRSASFAYSRRLIHIGAWLVTGLGHRRGGYQMILWRGWVIHSYLRTLRPHAGHSLLRRTTGHHGCPNFLATGYRRPDSLSRCLPVLLLKTCRHEFSLMGHGSQRLDVMHQIPHFFCF